MASPVGRLSRRSLRAMIRALRYTPLGGLWVGVTRQQLGIEALFALDPALAGALALDQHPLQARARHERPSQQLTLPEDVSWRSSARALTAGYAEQRVTALEATRASLRAARQLAQREPPMVSLCAYDDRGAEVAARAADERYARAAPLGPLDGVVVAVKEETRVRGLPCRAGTRWMPLQPCADDSTVVTRLRAAGAIIVGVTNMTEYGLSPLGENPHRVMPRNAHDADRLAGGSSTGSAVAVATGVVPVALGFDGGGSIRIPAALNGVFGLKPTFGRIPTSGSVLAGGSSVVHAGPIGAGAHELAIFLEATAGGDAGDPLSLGQPALPRGSCEAALGRGVRDLRIGVVRSEWADAPSGVTAPALAALDALARDGATLIDVELPLARHAAAIGYVTIGLEMATLLAAHRAKHFDAFSEYLQAFVLQHDHYGARDYLEAQRWRTALRAQTAALLAECDVLVLPTTATTAPTVTEQELRDGFFDPIALAGMSRYAYLGNLTGVPAATAPVGRGPDELPVGLQILGDAWDEACVLQVVAQLERCGAAAPLFPQTHVGALLR